MSGGGGGGGGGGVEGSGPVGQERLQTCSPFNT